MVVQQLNVIILVWEDVCQVFVVAFYHYEVIDLNSCLALLPPPLASPSLGGWQAWEGGVRRDFKFGNNIVFCLTFIVCHFLSVSF